MSKDTAETLLGELAWVRALARSLVRDASVAEDLVQDACLAVLSASPDSVERPRGFWRAVLHNAARQHARSEGARRERERAVSTPRELPSPDDLVSRMERQRELAEAVLKLDEPFRSTVILRYLDGLEPAEIARRQGVPAGTVRRRLKTALDRLRERLDHSFEGGRESWAIAFLPMLDINSSWASEVLGAKSTLLAGAIAMKKTLIAAGLIVIAASVVGVSTWIGHGPTRGSGSDRTVDSSRNTSASGTVGGETPALARAEDGGARTAAGARALAPGERAVRVSGRVIVPAGCEPDATLEVLALARPLEYGELARLMDEAAYDGAPARELESCVLARTRARPEGDFELEVPMHGPDGAAKPVAAYLAVRGRTLYTPETVELPLAGDVASVTLTPRAGACVTVELGVRGSDDARARTAGTALRLTGTSTDLTPAAGILGRGFGMNVRAGPDGRCELRAIPVEYAYQLFALPERLAAQKTELASLASCTARAISLDLGEGATLRGRVVDKQGRAVADATVDAMLPGRWLGLDDRRVRDVRTDAEGRFELDAVPAAALRVRAQKDGWLESEKLEITPQEGRTLSDLELVLDEGDTIRGRVTLASGAPVAGAEITAEFDSAFLADQTAMNARRGTHGSARSESDGRFALTGVGKGPFIVRAVAMSSDDAPNGIDDRTHARARRDGVRPDGSDVESSLSPPIALRGVVLDTEKRAVRSFDLEAVRIQQGALGATGMTRRRRHVEDAQGRFTLDDLEQGTWSIHAEAPGLVTREHMRVEIPSASANAAIELTLAPAASIAGRVLRADGGAAVGASVSVAHDAQSAGGEPTPGRMPPVARAAADGTFVLAGLEPGAVRFVAQAPDASALVSAPLDLDLAPAQAIDGVELVLRVGARLTGDVFDARGLPARGHLVHLAHAHGEVRFASTDGRGAFAFEHLEPGSWMVTAMDMEAGVTPPRGTEFKDAITSSVRLAHVDLLDRETKHIVLGAPAENPVQVHGTLTQGGRPRGGGWISFFPSTGGKAERFKLASVDKDGEYEVTLAMPGNYTASVQQIHDNDHCTIDFHRDIPAVATHRLDLVLPAGRLSGLVLRPDGKPAVSARVSVFSDGATHTGEYSQGQYTELLTDPRGRFEVPGLRGGKYMIAVGGPGEKSECFARTVLDDIAIPEDGARDDLVLRLPNPGAIRVRARDARSQPVDGAAIYVRDSAGRIVDPISSCVTHDDGRGMYGCLAPGSYTVQARKHSLASHESEAVRVTAGEEVDVELVLVPGTMLEISLADAEEHPASGWVHVFDEAEREAGGLYDAHEIEALFFNGAFSPSAPVVGPLAPGRYRVEAHAPGGLAAKQEITLAGEPEHPLRLLLSR